MLHVALYQPEIPPNTGNIIRLCANTGCALHVIHPLGFELDDSRLRRAGLDYHELAVVREHRSGWSEFSGQMRGKRILGISTRGTVRLDSLRFLTDDVLLFGPETRGLPETLLNAIPPEHRLRIPMRPGNRSLNLSNAVAVVVYEAWRQLAYVGSAED